MDGNHDLFFGQSAAMRTPKSWHTYKAIGERLIALRTAAGYPTAKAFARFIGIEETTLNNYERGIRRPPPDMLYKFVIATGVTSDWIYYGDRAGLPNRLAEKIPAPDETAPERSRA